jgi:hypothetical protein
MKIIEEKIDLIDAIRYVRKQEEKTIKDYHTDFDLDFYFAGKNHATIDSIVYMVRDSGTECIYMHNQEYYPKKGEFVPYLFGKADTPHIIQQNSTMLEYWKKNYSQYTWYYWQKFESRGILSSVNYADCIDIISIHSKYILEAVK